MKYVIVGTAGHVDHGKTTLIQRLTGVDTDRLSEEKKRGISIELGFAPFALPSGRLAGVVDVPGHEKFIKHMLAGAGGMDVVLLVIAANEGVMPQTLEHLHILNLLKIEQGIIVVTKRDLVDDEWMALVEQDIHEAVRSTFLEDAPLIAVSAVDGYGLDLLKETIDTVTQQVKGKDVDAAFRLPVDRIFTIKGAGTIVTGTLAAGRLAVGALVEILPSRQEARVRQLQVHGKKVDEASAGQRVAVNLAGIEVQDLERGNVIAKPALLHPTRALDIRLKLLSQPFGKEPNKVLQNRARVRFHTGTQEILGRILLLDSDYLEPGAETYAQILLEEEAVVARGDHYIVRSYSPVTTIGGGVVIEPYAKKHKRYQPDVIEEMMIKEQGTPDELIEQCILHDPEKLYFLENIIAETGLSDQIVEKAIVLLQEKKNVQIFKIDQRDLIIHMNVLAQYRLWIQDYLKRFHHQQPLKAGVPSEELRAKLFKTMTPRIFSVLLNYFVEEGILVQDGQKLKLPEFTIVFSEKQLRIHNALLKAWEGNKFSPPAVSELAESLGQSVSEVEAVAEAMVENGEVIKMQSGEIIFSKQAWNEAIDFVKTHIAQNEAVTLSEFRDKLGTSRKFALALLEQMDEQKITKRLGDKRILSK